MKFEDCVLCKFADRAMLTPPCRACFLHKAPVRFQPKKAKPEPSYYCPTNRPPKR